MKARHVHIREQLDEEKAFFTKYANKRLSGTSWFSHFEDTEQLIWTAPMLEMLIRTLSHRLGVPAHYKASHTIGSVDFEIVK